MALMGTRRCDGYGRRVEEIGMGEDYVLIDLETSLTTVLETSSFPSSGIDPAPLVPYFSKVFRFCC